MGRNRPSNKDAPRVPGEEGGRPWGRIVLGLLLLLALALLIPFACQALQGSGDGGSGDPGSSGGERTADDGSGRNQNGAAGGETTASGGRGAAGDAETTEENAGDDAAGDSEERSGGIVASIADIRRAGSGGGRVVTVPRAEIPGTEGWLAVHADDNGQPGEVLGVAPLRSGENTDIEVELDRTLDSSQRLYAMLHREDPPDGEYTFPDGDPPVEENGEAVVEPFDYELASAPADGDGADAASTDETGGVEEESLPDSGGGAFAAVIGGLALLAAGGLLRFHVRRASR